MQQVSRLRTVFSPYQPDPLPARANTPTPCSSCCCRAFICAASVSPTRIPDSGWQARGNDDDRGSGKNDHQDADEHHGSADQCNGAAARPFVGDSHATDGTMRVRFRVSRYERAEARYGQRRKVSISSATPPAARDASCARRRERRGRDTSRNIDCNASRLDLGGQSLREDPIARRPRTATAP